MKKWLLTLDGRTIEYDNFNDAKAEFLDSIIEIYLEHKDAFINTIPKSVTHVILERLSSLDITDDEIVTYERLKILLNGLFNGETDFNIERSCYSKVKMDDDVTEVKIVKDESIIFLELLFDYTEYIKTNAFNMNDDTTYFFGLNMSEVTRDKEKRTITFNHLFELEPIEEI